ncbi:MAG: hypothetical protein MZV70_06155 [Desulfobacterales bacterium]|nr:hypothetical protein [Desulfobacterales bacterium]
MARWYAPRDTSRADWRTERLFYTRENAVFLDRVREHIERAYPLGPSPSIPTLRRARRRDLLLALLILEAAVHANTSGVFKAFHKGFGGHGRDAPPRILGAMELEPPLLPEAERAGGLPRGRGRLRPPLDRGPGVPGSCPTTSTSTARTTTSLNTLRALGPRPRSPGHRAGRTAPPEGGHSRGLEGDPVPLLRPVHGPGGPGRA